MGGRQLGAGRRVVGVVCAALVVLALSSCQPDRLRPPVALPAAHNFPDPTVFYGQGRYQAFATNTFGESPRRIQVMTSTDLYAWSEPVEALTDGPSWAWDLDQGGRFWAPTVARFGSTYVLYFAANHTGAPVDAPAWCIGHATSSSAAGPFTPAARPLLCQVLKHTSPSPLSSAPRGADHGVIDPQVYVGANGASYLHVKALDNPYQLWGAALNSTGTGFRTQGVGMLQLGAKVRVWEYSPAADNRFTVLENPSMDLNPNAPAGYQHLLYYSGGDWRTSAYGTGVAACEGPIGPCTRITTEEPWLASRGSSGGPGGLSVFRAAGGATWVAYHSWLRGAPTSNGRRLHVEPLGYDGLTATLLSRPPTGSLQASATLTTVTLSGRGDDPDTGRRMTVILKEGSERLAEPTVDAANSYSVTLAATPGMHRYCAFVVDDNGLGTRNVGCAEVTVGPVAAAPPSAAPSTTTTAPTSTSTTTSTLAVPSTSSTSVGAGTATTP